MFAISYNQGFAPIAKAAMNRRTPQLFELTHQVGSGLGRLLNFYEAVFSMRGTIDVLVEEVGIGGDDAKKVVQRVRDGLRTARSRDRWICKTEG